MPYSLGWDGLVMTDEKDAERGKRDGNELGIFRFWLTHVSDLIWVFFFFFLKKNLVL